MHGIVVAMFALLTATVVLAGRRAKEQRRRRIERAAGVAIIVCWIAVTALWLTPARFEPASSLPLHLCDVTALVAAAVLLTGARIPRAILHFWGLALNTQAFITPLLRAGPGELTFWVFWWLHFVIVGTAVYDLIVGRFRPTWTDYLIAVSGSLIYLLLVLPLDIAFGWNYGYVGSTTPDRPTIIDVLGPWPQRVVVICVLVCAAMALVMLPWALVGAIRTKPKAQDTSPSRDEPVE